MVKMEKYEVESGIAVLKGLFHAFSPDQYKLPDENTIKRREPVSETISEWEVEKDSKGEEHYYLKQQTGYATQSDAKTRVDLQAVGAHSIVAIIIWNRNNMRMKMRKKSRRNVLQMH